MLRSIVAALTVLFIAAACVSVSSPQTAAPTIGPASAVPSPAVTTPVPATAVPTVAPTATPTVPPTLPPTLMPSLAPTLPPPTLEPTIGPSSMPSAEPASDRDLLFEDDMSDSNSGWHELDEDFATISYDTGALAFRFNQRSWALTARDLESPESSIVVAARFAPQSKGWFGSLCGNKAADDLFGVALSTGGDLVFIEATNGTITPLERHDKLGLEVPIGDQTALALTCITDASGSLTMTAGLSSTGPVASYHQDDALTGAFDLVGLYGEALDAGYTLAVDVAAAWGVGGSDATVSSGAQDLLGHVPSDFQSCNELPVFSTSAQYIVGCYVVGDGDGAELLQYQQFASADAMNAVYRDLVQAFGVESLGSCKTGPNETTWSIDQVVYGRVQCAPQAVGIRFDWTDERLNILSSLVDTDGSYEGTYSQWIAAGPNS